MTRDTIKLPVGIQLTKPSEQAVLLRKRMAAIFWISQNPLAWMMRKKVTFYFNRKRRRICAVSPFAR